MFQECLPDHCLLWVQKDQQNQACQDFQPAQYHLLDQVIQKAQAVLRDLLVRLNPEDQSLLLFQVFQVHQMALSVQESLAAQDHLKDQGYLSVQVLQMVPLNQQGQ